MEGVGVGVVRFQLRSPTYTQKCVSPITHEYEMFTWIMRNFPAVFLNYTDRLRWQKSARNNTLICRLILSSQAAMMQLYKPHLPTIVNIELVHCNAIFCLRI